MWGKNKRDSKLEDLMAFTFEAQANPDKIKMAVSSVAARAMTQEQIEGFVLGLGVALGWTEPPVFITSDAISKNAKNILKEWRK